LLGTSLWLLVNPGCLSPDIFILFFYTHDITAI
jgi:hypothetical protein